MSNTESTIDLIGLRCPIPVQRVRSVLRSIEPGGHITVIGDDPESLHDIPKLLDRLGLRAPEITETEIGWVYDIQNVGK